MIERPPFPCDTAIERSSLDGMQDLANRLERLASEVNALQQATLGTLEMLVGTVTELLDIVVEQDAQLHELAWARADHLSEVNAEARGTQAQARQAQRRAAEVRARAEAIVGN